MAGNQPGVSAVTLDDARAALNAGADLGDVLRRVWHLLSGAGAHAMAGYKLDRIENPSWRDPVATFQIERHGEPVGQTQRWRIDLRDGTAHCVSETPLRSRVSQQWDEGGLAAELARAIEAGEDDPRLRWRNSQRDAVKIVTTEVLPGAPSDHGPLATRLHRALAAELRDRWTRELGYWVKRSPS
ncbi:MAG: hypothetical protein ACXVR9_08670 [Gaiellaceae bacterium]